MPRWGCPALRSAHVGTGPPQDHQRPALLIRLSMLRRSRKNGQRKGILPSEPWKWCDVSLVLLLYSEGGLGWLIQKAWTGRDSGNGQKGRDGSGAERAGPARHGRRESWVWGWRQQRVLHSRLRGPCFIRGWGVYQIRPTTCFRKSVLVGSQYPT